MRDPTRGGLAATLNEFAHQSRRRLLDRGGGDSGQAAGRGGLRVSRPRSAQRRQRGQAGGGRCAGGRRGAARGDAAASARPRGARSSAARSRTPTFCRDAHGVRRRAHRRLARGRAIAADLLNRMNSVPPRPDRASSPRPCARGRRRARARWRLCGACLSDEFEVIEAADAAEAEAVLAGELVEVMLCDQRMPRRIRRRLPQARARALARYDAHHHFRLYGFRGRDRRRQSTPASIAM